MPIDDLFPESDFGSRCVELFRAEKIQVGICSPDRMRAIINEEVAKAFPQTHPEKKQRQKRREDLFDALVKACGINRRAMTEAEERITAVALAQIVKVCPGVDERIFMLRARRFAMIFSGAICTPKAMANHWGKLTPREEAKKVDLNIEPAGWREKAMLVWGDVTIPERWLDLSIVARADLISK